MSESDVYRLQILTYKDGPRAERVKGKWQDVSSLAVQMVKFERCGNRSSSHRKARTSLRDQEKPSLAVGRYDRWSGVFRRAGARGIRQLYVPYILEKLHCTEPPAPLSKLSSTCHQNGVFFHVRGRPGGSRPEWSRDKTRFLPFIRKWRGRRGYVGQSHTKTWNNAFSTKRAASVISWGS